MKAKDIKEYSLGNGCFSEIISVNGVDYEDISKEEMIEFIHDMLEGANPNSSNLILETFKNCLQNLEYDCIVSDSSTCEQCGSWNHYAKYTINQEANEL